MLLKTELKKRKRERKKKALDPFLEEYSSINFRGKMTNDPLKHLILLKQWSEDVV